MDFDSLLALASERRWDETMAALAHPENRPLCPEVVVRFEELGDGCLASGSVLDATRYFAAAITGAMILLYAPASGEDPSWLVAPFTRLNGKAMDARRRFDGERGADTSGPVGRTSGTDRIVALGLMGRFAEADDLLERLDEANSRSSKNHASCGRRLEAAADRSPALQPEMAIWFLERALERFERAKRLAPGGEAGPAWAVELDRVKRKLAVLLPSPAIPEKVEMQAQEPQVNPAASARDAGELEKVETARLEEKIAHPLGSDFDPGPLHWEHGMDAVESQALARRFREADRFLGRLWRLADDPTNGFGCVARLESTGDRLERKYPELARWFYEKFHEYSRYLPADTAAEGRDREAVTQTAAQKLAGVKARLPKPRATIRLSLAGWGNPTRKAPDRQIPDQTVADEGTLTLAPEWVFAHYREEGGGALRPEQWPGRYRYRVRVDGRHVELSQTDDEYGRRQPFDLGEPAAAPDGHTAHPFRLKIGKPVTIHCGVPGGGPEWTLTLSGIDETAP
jgi:hypothetical protein